VAVVALLKEMGVDERLGTLIEGESLMNDGSAYVMFVIFARAITCKFSSFCLAMWLYLPSFCVSL
jgi:NhaP-type Na+/H+ or K+/H+ antiporter